MNDQTKRDVLVIGGSRGIGAAIVRRFTEGGDRVSFTYAGSTEAAEALARETGAEAIRCDAASRAQMTDLVRGTEGLDVLVYNAGLFVGGDPLEIDPDDVDRLVDVNVRGAYHASVEAGRKFVDGGSIVVIGSSNGDRVPFEGQAAYSMTKSAMQGMARGLARDFGPRGITVNVVQPGPTDTDMNPADGPMGERMRGQMAIPRHGNAADVAHLVHYLAGPHARGITGALHTIDGGFVA